MDRMLVAVFDSEKEASEGMRALQEMHAEGNIVLNAMAVIAKASLRFDHSCAKRTRSPFDACAHASPTHARATYPVCPLAWPVRYRTYRSDKFGRL